MQREYKETLTVSSTFLWHPGDQVAILLQIDRDGELKTLVPIQQHLGSEEEKLCQLKSRNRCQDRIRNARGLLGKKMGEAEEARRTFDWTATQLSLVRERDDRKVGQEGSPQCSAEKGLASQWEVLEQKSPVRGSPHLSSIELLWYLLCSALGWEQQGGGFRVHLGHLSIKLSATGDLRRTSLWPPKRIM